MVKLPLSPSMRLDDAVRAVADLPFERTDRNEDVVRLMAENHVIVVPSLWWENSPLVIEEAKAAGCIILGSDLGGVGEKLRAASNGRTFGYNDADDLADELIAIQGRTHPKRQGCW